MPSAWGRHGTTCAIASWRGRHTYASRCGAGERGDARPRRLPKSAKRGPAHARGAPRTQRRGSVQRVVRASSARRSCASPTRARGPTPGRGRHRTGRAARSTESAASGGFRGSGHMRPCLEAAGRPGSGGVSPGRSGRLQCRPRSAVGRRCQKRIQCCRPARRFAGDSSTCGTPLRTSRGARSGRPQRASRTRGT